MKVLYITGSCLQCNTSANMSHNSYLQGLIENGCEVDVIMSDRGTLPIDKAMPVYKGVNYYEYESLSKLDWLKSKVKKIVDRNTGMNNVDRGISGNSGQFIVIQRRSFHFIIRTILKFIYNMMINPETPYHLSKYWMKNASRFISNNNYEILISNSSPASSHALAYRLINNRNIKCKKWIQLWEDPWYYDLYMTRKNINILEEERKLLSYANEIYYVSPLTLLYQKKYFPQSADKMKCIPLSYFKIQDSCLSKQKNDKCVFGYFGDYYSQVRNLKPFYDAIKELDGYANIYGDNNENFRSTDKIIVEKRISVEKLHKIQTESDVFIMLCNLRGGQVPGKVYHYSATDKPIIFILDGTEEEKTVIYKYFSKFNRYHFCDNSKEAIMKVLSQFIDGQFSKQSFCINEFSPKNVVRRILSFN